MSTPLNIPDLVDADPKCFLSRDRGLIGWGQAFAQAPFGPMRITQVLFVMHRDTTRGWYVAHFAVN